MKPVTLILFGLVLVAQAAEPISDPVLNLSSEQAIALAATSHPDLAEARAEIIAASGRAEQAGLWPNPELVGRLESIPFDNDEVNTSEYLAGVSQTIPVGGRLSSARKADLAQRDRLTEMSTVRWREISTQVRKAFATGLYQDRAAQLQAQVLANTEKAAAVVQARLDAGDATQDEVARAKIQVARAQVEAQRSRAMQRQALSDLMAAMGSPNIRIEGLGGSLEDAFEIPALEEVAGDVSSHPELRAAQAGEQAAVARLDLAKSERIPDINVEVLYRRIEAVDANTFDIGLRIPIPAWGGNRGMVRAARAELEVSQIRSRATAKELERRVELSQAQLTASLTMARSLRTDVIPHANTIRQTMEKRLAAGDISLAEFLPADRDWTNTQVVYLESLRDVMVAWAEVRSLMNPEQASAR